MLVYRRRCQGTGAHRPNPFATTFAKREQKIDKIINNPSFVLSFIPEKN
jgi:hypothetical protein